MIASLVTAMAALAMRVGLRKPAAVKSGAQVPLKAVPVAQQQRLQCPVCGDRHTAGNRDAAVR